MNVDDKIAVVMTALMRDPEDCPSAAQRDAIAVVLSEFFALGQRLDSIAMSLNLLAHPLRVVEEPVLSAPDQQPFKS
jgi:hypothetical protein